MQHFPYVLDQGILLHQEYFGTSALEDMFYKMDFFKVGNWS